MMKKVTPIFILLAVAGLSFFMASCNKYKGYEKTESGIYYKFHKKTDSIKVEAGDEAEFRARYYLKDSVLHDAFSHPVKQPMFESQYIGDIFECFSLMSVGDSATFIIQADSFFLKTARAPKLPKFVTPKTKLYLDIELLGLKTKKEIEIEKQKQLAEYKAKEEKDIEEYKTKNHFSKKFAGTDIFYKPISRGKGNYPDSSDMITVDYVVRVLNGRRLGGTDITKKPMVFECFGKNHETKAFNLAISKMRKGEKAEFIVPSSYAFGEEGMTGRILPYTPLFYEIEIVGIQSKAAYIAAKEEKDRELVNAEEEKIANYLKENNITESPRESGLYYIEKKEGLGKRPQEGDVVKVHYTLYTLEGKKIDSSVDRGQPFTFTVGKGQVIAGWDEALTLMKEGAQATLLIPSKIAYGDRQRSKDILPYTPLRFEVELLEIEK